MPGHVAGAATIAGNMFSHDGHSCGIANYLERLLSPYVHSNCTKAYRFVPAGKTVKPPTEERERTGNALMCTNSALYASHWPQLESIACLSAVL